MPDTMRRKELLMDQDRAWEILAGSSYGVMAVFLPEGTPYAVPLNFVRVGQMLYAHCAMEGQKLRAIAHNPQVCINVVARQEVSARNLTTYFQSVTAFGTARLVADEAERECALECLCDKFAPGWREAMPNGVRGCMGRTAVIAVEVSELTGKDKPARPV